MLVRISCDGTHLSGAALLPGARTVAGVLTEAAARLGASAPQVDVWSRLDAGVHAKDLVLSLEGLPMGPERALPALAQQLPDDVRPWRVGEGPVRLIEKEYRYQLDLSPWGDPMVAPFAWRPPRGVVVETLSEALALQEGARSWSAFVRRGDDRAPSIRELRRATVTVSGHLVVLTFVAPSFFYRQVRSLVGAAVAVARGAHSLTELGAALEGAPGGVAAQMAPARGLCLWQTVTEGGRWFE